MKKELLIIINKQEIMGREFTIYGSKEEPLFLAKDVAEMIEHSDTSKMIKNVDDDEKLMRTMFLSGQSRECLFLTEEGLYEVLMQSRKPIAKAFKKEVKVVLKSIRLNGAYIPNATAEETKVVAKAFRSSKYLTEEIHDRKSLQKFIREFDLMKLDECITEIINIVSPCKGDIKHILIDKAVSELNIIKKNRFRDSIKNVFIIDTINEGIIEIQKLKIKKLLKVI